MASQPRGRGASIDNLKQCSAITAQGARCQRVIGQSQSFCYSHDETRGAERRANASKAARAKNGHELTEVKSKLRSLAADVEAGRLSTARGSVTAQLYGVLLRAIEQERKQREADELVHRIEELEEAAE
jgi:hypothetical protein